MDGISIKVYAKINLSLDITGARKDGYHLLDMHNASADIFDVVTARESRINRAFIDGIEVDGSNTAAKALNILGEKYGVSMQVDIKKGIPFSAGLGGSSADASGVFYCAHKLFDIDLEELKKLALQVGCDVPYMMSGGNARVRGVGDKVAPEQYERLILVVCQSAVGASTKDIYAKYDKVGGYPKSGKNYNALEKAAVALAPRILGAKEQLLKFTDRVFMTGSGSAFVGVFDDMESAERCADSLEDCIFKSVAVTLVGGIAQV